MGRRSLGDPVRANLPCRLVVEDDSDNAEMLQMTLQLMGYEVLTAHDGLEAIQTAASLRPHVILLDIGLPKSDGHVVARRIRRQSWGRSVALIALSGYGQAEDQARAMEAGFDRYLTKPVSPEKLERVLVEVTGSREMDDATSHGDGGQRHDHRRRSASLRPSR